MVLQVAHFLLGLHSLTNAKKQQRQRPYFATQPSLWKIKIKKQRKAHHQLVNGITDWKLCFAIFHLCTNFIKGISLLEISFHCLKRVRGRGGGLKICCSHWASEQDYPLFNVHVWCTNYIKWNHNWWGKNILRSVQQSLQNGDNYKFCDKYHGEGKIVADGWTGRTWKAL